MDEIVTAQHRLRPCRSGQCNRRVGDSCAFCCGPCAAAWEADPRHETDGHSAGCDERYEARRAAAGG